MKRKESAFKSMLKQATPPIELDAVWEDVCMFLNFADELLPLQLKIKIVLIYFLFYSHSDKLKLFVEYEVSCD